MEDAIILHFTADPAPDPLRAPGTAPEDVGRPMGWDDRNAFDIAHWPGRAPDLVDTRTRAPAATHLYWPTLQLAYPEGSLVPVELLPQLIDQQEYDEIVHPQPKPKRRRK